MKTSKTLFLMIGAAALVVLCALLFRTDGPPPDPTPAVGPQAAPSNETEAGSTPEPPAPLPLRESVLRLTGRLGQGTPGSRREALKVLPRDLNQKELHAIYASILEHPQPEAFSRRAWHAFLNDTLNALVLDQKKPVADLPDRLMATVQDAARHRVIRDYALQHLLAFAEYRMESSRRMRLLDSAWVAVSETRDSYRGTYLVALSYKADEPGWPSSDAVAAKAWQVAGAGDAHVLSRITALQVCGKLGHAEALSLAVEIAGDAQAHMTLRTSAIATIGDLGSGPERAMLASLAERSPPRLQVAIKAALTRIEAKETQV